MIGRPRTVKQDFSLSLVIAVGMAAVGRVIAIVAEYLGASQSLAHWLDDILTGVVAGAAMFVVFRGMASRSAANAKRLRDIGEMNHHVRNALQVIRKEDSISQYLQGFLKPIIENPTGYGADALAAMKSSVTVVLSINESITSERTSTQRQILLIWRSALSCTSTS